MPSPKSLIVFSSAVLAVLLVIVLWQTFAPAGPVLINGVEAPPVPPLNAQMVADGARLYAERCAACHGADLEGQPEWRVPLANGMYPAPPHDVSGHTWHHGDQLLAQIIREGSSRPSTMPAFGNVLDAAQIEAILAFLKSKWGREEREFQWWISATQEGAR